MRHKKAAEETRTVCYGSEEITYLLKRKKVKNINLRIKPDLIVTVSAPYSVSAKYIDDFIIRKKDFISKALSQLKSSQNSKNKSYTDGEIFYLEGRGLELKVVPSDSDSIASDGSFLVLNVKNTEDTAIKEKLVQKFYKEKAKAITNDIIDSFGYFFVKYNVKKPFLKFRTMRTRWGSCNSVKGNVTINIQLMEAPRSCIEYVVMHELCHLIHPNHSADFYSFLAEQMPDWKERKKALEAFFQAPA